ncbi:unnamed protein product [Brugia timori]|uniref:Uncharacterized protein n=1 Tax=Brugia timori TaxID=42155 RepID=A0A0R3QTS8_9BILA|nr:unnamed protein product [Brugia timori]
MPPYHSQSSTKYNENFILSWFIFEIILIIFHLPI